MKKSIPYKGCADCDAAALHDGEHCWTFGVYLCDVCYSQRERDQMREIRKTMELDPRYSLRAFSAAALRC